MTPSLAVKQFVKKFETLQLRAMMPTSHDRPTIGWGTTFYPDGRAVKLGETCTEKQADGWFSEIFDRTAAHVDELTKHASVAQNQFDAMCSLAYNIGIGGFKTSSVLRLTLLGKYTLAAGGFGLWVKQAGITLNGLVRRRAAEARFYLTGPTL